MHLDDFFIGAEYSCVWMFWFPFGTLSMFLNCYFFYMPCMYALEVYVLCSSSNKPCPNLYVSFDP